MTGPSFYHEEQRISQWWVWVIVLVVAGLSWWALVQQVVLGRPWGDDPAPDWGVWLYWVLVGLAVPTLLWWSRLILDVTGQEVSIRYRPFTRRSIPLTEIEDVSVRTYSPVKEYGGWGIKGWSRRNVVYNARGNRGVQLILRDDRKVMLGSQRPEELAAAIRSQLVIYTSAER